MWFKVDDNLWGSPKWLALGPGPRALWVSAGSWSGNQLTDGFIPTYLVPVLGGTPADADDLVRVALWETADGGWVFHDWADYQVARDVVVAKREQDAQRKADWRAKKAAKRAVPWDVPDVSQRDTPWDSARTDVVTPRGVQSVSHSSRPDPTRPDPTAPKGAEITTSRAADATRPDVDRLCTHLADRIEANGSKRPRITQAWKTDARRLLDLDGRTEQQIHTAIDWCQDSDFWRANVMSMGKLREKFDQLRLAAQRQARSLDPQADLLRAEMERAILADQQRDNRLEIGA